MGKSKTKYIYQKDMKLKRFKITETQKVGEEDKEVFEYKFEDEEGNFTMTMRAPYRLDFNLDWNYQFGIQNSQTNTVVHARSRLFLNLRT